MLETCHIQSLIPHWLSSLEKLAPWRLLRFLLLCLFSCLIDEFKAFVVQSNAGLCLIELCRLCMIVSRTEAGDLHLLQWGMLRMLKRQFECLMAR